jgi:gliding motility-associated-like protein
VLVCPNDLPFALTDDIIIDGSQNNILDTLNNSLNCDSVITYDISYAPSYEVNPNYIIANLGDSVSFVINGMNADVLFAYSSNNGSECPSPCNDYILIPTQEFNNYYFSIIDTSTNCNFSDTLIIESRIFSELNVPNIFTPNNDGRNDIFRCYGENIDQYSLEIFDRFGGRMFKSTELISGWDGYFLGQPVESGVYTAIIEATGLDGQKYSIAQIIKLVR